MYDIVRSGGDPEGKIYGRANMFTDPKAIALAEGLLGLYDYELKLHSQVCGQLLHMHMDNFAARLDRQNSFDELDYDVDPKKVHRFVVFLNDWSMGQIWHQGTAVHTLESRRYHKLALARLPTRHGKHGLGHQIYLTIHR